MNCVKHQEIVAIATCENCGVGLCSDCVNVSEYRIENKPLCRDCNYQLANELLSKNQTEKGKLLIKSIINAVFLILGVIAFFSNPVTGVILFAIGGIPAAWKIVKPSEKDKMQNKIDDAIADQKDVGGGFVNMIIRFLMTGIITVIFGAIAAPVLLIINIVKFVKIDKEIKDQEELIANFER